MMHPVDWKMKENGYLFSTLYLPWDCCVSAYCNTSYVHFCYWQETHIIWYFFELTERKSYSWDLRIINVFFSWNLSTWVSRKVILKSQNFFIIFHFPWKKLLEWTCGYCLLCTEKLVYILKLLSTVCCYRPPYPWVPHLWSQPTMDRRYLKKIPEISNKQNLNLPHTRHYAEFTQMKWCVGIPLL